MCVLNSTQIPHGLADPRKSGGRQRTARLSTNRAVGCIIVKLKSNARPYLVHYVTNVFVRHPSKYYILVDVASSNAKEPIRSVTVEVCVRGKALGYHSRQDTRV